MFRLNLKIAALAVAFGALASAPSSAAPVVAPMSEPGLVLKTAAPGAAASAGQTLDQSAVEKVRRGYYYAPRRYYGYGPRYGYGSRYGYYRGYRGGRWIAPAIIGGIIIGGTIAQSQAGYRDRWEMCAERYQSFSWSDGTFQPYDGPRRLCPYLH